MIRFIENIGDYYSQHFFTDDFPKKVFDKAGYVTQKMDSDGNKTANHLTEINSRISPLREKYYKFKNDLFSIQREKDKVKRTHDFHKELLDALGYIHDTPEYSAPVFLNDTEVIPVRYNYFKGGKPYLFIMEMKAIVREGEKEPDGIYEQTWIKDDWEKVFPSAWGDVILKPDVIKEALSELFLLPEGQRPVYVVMLAGAKIFLVHYEKWKYDSFLLFDLEELFNESLVSTNRDYLALFYALLAKHNFLSDSDSLLQTLDEDAHKAAYGVTQNLKKGVIYAVESLANESIWYKKSTAKTVEEKDAIEELMADEKFARELKDECLTMVYRLLFLFYAEAREDLEILPVKDSTYQKGYSLEMLRDLEMVPLTTDSSRNGYFISESLWKLFEYLHNGVKTKNGFEMKPLDSPLFDNEEMKHLHGVQFRNVVLQQIIKHLSLSDQTKGKRRGRISYANLGINQLGSVYESLLAYSGFFASEPLIEVKAADDKDGKEGTFLVPLTRRDDFKEEEILKDSENDKFDKSIQRGYFVYRLNGRDRKKSASYYTPEVLTQTTVKYTLKGIVDSLKERQKKGEFCADEILSLKILEPAMGAAAFQNEVINQLADAYLELKETEETKKGRTRIVPGSYSDEMQKVKAFIAANNVYGVDLNPTAVELGKLSLWLNCMHRNMETPFFAHRLGTGNAVVGCWLKVYDEKDVITEYPKSGTQKQKSTSLPKAWWNQAPSRITFDKKGNISRKQKQFYHFLLPDENMLASADIALIKEDLSDAQRKAIINWKKEFKKPLSTSECNRLEKLCRVIDTLIEEHYKQIKGIIKDTTSAYAVYGKESPQMPLKGYDEKERLAEGRKARSAPFYKLRMVMDYWCSLWFWDARRVVDLPSREQWHNEIENILGIDLSSIPEDADSTQILVNIKKHSVDTSGLFGSEIRLSIVESLREQHRFFHHELEFLEVFKDRGGFDLIVGNPPWVNIILDEGGILSDVHPELVLRDFSSPQISKEAASLLGANAILRKVFCKEAIWAESSKSFIAAFQNYYLLDGQRNNLYKCILINSIELLNRGGFSGLIHPEGIYEDPKARELRMFLYEKLVYHFQFKNEVLLFAEVIHTRMFGVNIYRSKNDTIGFQSISNLFHPSTIDLCLQPSNTNSSLGLKKYNAKKKKYEWNLDGNSSRTIHVDANLLNTLSKVYDSESNKPLGVLLPKLHSVFLLDVLRVFSSTEMGMESKNVFITDCWNEVTAVNAGLIIKESGVWENQDEILSSPHIFVNNPYYKNPFAVCTAPTHYECVDLTKVDETFVRRTNFKKGSDSSKSIDSDKGKAWLKSYKIALSKMIDPGTERTLQPTIIPPFTTHTNSIISISFENAQDLIAACGAFSSLIFDFFIKSTGRTNLYDKTIKSIPFIDFTPAYFRAIALRTLRLNCLTKGYSSLWENSFCKSFIEDDWSIEDERMSSNSLLNLNWSSSTPLRNYFERRMCQLEIDVIVSIFLGIKLEGLINLYETQFPTFYQNEEDTWYDAKGSIIYTVNSQGLKGVGIDRKTWESLTVEETPMIRVLKSGNTYTHTTVKSELYMGSKSTYYSPFNKGDRIEDYKKAWIHFTNVFASK